MLSTQYRLRLEFICKCIVNEEEVKLEDMIWANKLAKANRSAAEMLRKARRKRMHKDAPKRGLDNFMIDMNLGDGDSYSSDDDIAEWFHQERTDDWRQHD